MFPEWMDKEQNFSKTHRLLAVEDFFWLGVLLLSYSLLLPRDFYVCLTFQTLTKLNLKKNLQLFLMFQ